MSRTPAGSGITRRTRAVIVVVRQWRNLGLRGDTRVPPLSISKVKNREDNSGCRLILFYTIYLFIYLRF